MNEAQWLEGECGVWHFNHASKGISNRKARLLLLAALQRIEGFLPELMRLSFATIGRVADGHLSRNELNIFRESFKGEAFFSDGFTGERNRDHRYNTRIARKLLGFACAQNAASSLPHILNHARNLEMSLTVSSPPNPDPELYPQEDKRILEQHIEVLKDIIGNPFRPVTIDPSWLTSIVVALATGIYADRAFDRMPILADALQDARCENADILNHCRQPGEHVRGCWVVDSLLGKS
jgi:hypothetical protein